MNRQATVVEPQRERLGRVLGNDKNSAPKRAKVSKVAAVQGKVSPDAVAELDGQRVLVSPGGQVDERVHLPVSSSRTGSLRPAAPSG